jgi:hypothetical protein
VSQKGGLQYGPMRRAANEDRNGTEENHFRFVDQGV